MKKTLLSNSFSLSYLFFLLILASCGVSGKKEAGTGQLDTSAVSEKSAMLNAVDSLLTIMPKPSAVPNIIARTGIEYNAGLLSDAKTADKVEGNASATAFCLGVLGADIAYMAAYEKGKEAMARFGQGKKMADRIGISGAFDVDMMERLERNLSNRDSLIDLTDGYIRKSSEILKTGEQTKDAALISAGAVIEGLYLTAGLIREYPTTGLPKEEQDKILVPLYKTLFDQEASVQNLVFLLEKVGGDSESDKLLSMLKGLSDIYRKGRWNEKVAASQGKFSSELFKISELDASIVKIRQTMVP